MKRGGGERWVWIVGYEGRYEVSDRGRVRSVDRLVMQPHPKTGKPFTRRLKGRPLNGYWDGRYWTVALGKRDRQRVHVAVAEAFVGPRPTPDHEVRHWDGDSQNNSAENLLWGTRQDNADDTVRLCEMPRGYHHWNAKLSLKDVLEIRSLRGPVGSLADRFGVHVCTVQSILRGATWNIPEAFPS